MQSQDTVSTTQPQQTSGLVEYLAADPAARDGVRVTLLNDWSLHGRLLATYRDGFTLATPRGGAYYVMAAAVVAAEVRKVPA